MCLGSHLPTQDRDFSLAWAESSYDSVSRVVVSAESENSGGDFYCWSLESSF